MHKKEKEKEIFDVGYLEGIFVTCILILRLYCTATVVSPKYISIQVDERLQDGPVSCSLVDLDSRMITSGLQGQKIKRKN